MIRLLARIYTQTDYQTSYRSLPKLVLDGWSVYSINRAIGSKANQENPIPNVNKKYIFVLSRCLKSALYTRKHVVIFKTEGKLTEITTILSFREQFLDHF